MSCGHRAGVITRVPYLRPISIVAILETVDPQIIQGFSRIDAQMHIVTLRMIRQAHLLAMGEPTIRLCFALKFHFDSTYASSGTSVPQ